MRNRSSLIQAGFALVELLVAVAALATIVAGGMAVWRRGVSLAPAPTFLPRSSSTAPNTSLPESPPQGIQFTEMDEALRGCISIMHIKQRVSDRDSLEFIINTDEEYQALSEYKSPADYCNDFRLPPIGFSRFTLLGKYAE